jgi:twitching motility protein PilT
MLLDLPTILKTAVDHQASDIHLSAGMVPMLRILGDLYPIDGASQVSTGDVYAYLVALSPSGNSSGDPTKPPMRPDFSYSDETTGRRFRINSFIHSRGQALAIRLVPATIPTLAEIDAPPTVVNLAMRSTGLVVVTGPTGAGKSATLAAMVNHLNHHRRAHILTLEDPIEHHHKSVGCLISQREIHAHARGYVQALKEAMREDPDVILVGEMRDQETIRMALTAAETGHLVLATLHTASAPNTIDRIIDVFPAAEKEVVRTMLAESLQGVIAQRLVRHKNEKERIAVFEILTTTPAIRTCIKDGQIGQIRGMMGTGREHGMITLDQALSEHVRLGNISKEEALRITQDTAH